MTAEKAKRPPLLRPSLLDLAEAAMHGAPDLRAGERLGDVFRGTSRVREVQYADDRRIAARLLFDDNSALITRDKQVASATLEEGLAVYETLSREVISEEGAVYLRSTLNVSKRVAVGGVAALVMLSWNRGVALDSLPYASYDILLRRRLEEGLHFEQRASFARPTSGELRVEDRGCGVHDARENKYRTESEAIALAQERFSCDSFLELGASACEQLILL